MADEWAYVRVVLAAGKGKEPRAQPAQQRAEGRRTVRRPRTLNEFE